MLCAIVRCSWHFQGNVCVCEYVCVAVAHFYRWLRTQLHSLPLNWHIKRQNLRWSRQLLRLSCRLLQHAARRMLPLNTTSVCHIEQGKRTASSGATAIASYVRVHVAHIAQRVDSVGGMPYCPTQVIDVCHCDWRSHNNNKNRITKKSYDNNIIDTQQRPRACGTAMCVSVYVCVCVFCGKHSVR